MDNLGWGLIRIKDKAIFVATFVSFESRIDFLKSQGWSVFSRSGPSFKGYVYIFFRTFWPMAQTLNFLGLHMITYLVGKIKFHTFPIHRFPCTRRVG